MAICPNPPSDAHDDNHRATAGICFDWTEEAANGLAHRFDDDDDDDGFAPVPFLPVALGELVSP